MPNPLTLLGDSLKALATSQRLSFSPSTSGLAPSSVWLGSFPSGAKKDYGALVGDPLHNYVIAAAVNAVALALPDAPPYLENLQDGRWVRVDDHPVLGFLRQPHEDLDDADVWSLTSLYRLTRGEAFWVIHLSDSGLPAEAVPTDPRRVRVIGTRDELISGYEVTTEDGRLLPFPKQQVLHFRHLPDPNNPRRGWTPLSTGTRHIVGSNAASTYHTALLLNGAVSSWLISMRDSGQANVTPEQFQSFIDAMRRKYSGTTESAGGIDGLSIPLEIQRMAYSPDEMAIDKLVDYYEQTLCSLTGVSKKLLDLGADATYLNLREAISDFWERRLVPMRNKDARALTNQLLPLFGLSPGQWRVAFDFSNVPALQENQDAKFTRWRDLFKAGGCDLYTLQTKIGLPDVPDAYKERFWNTPPKGDEDETPEEADEEGDDLEVKAKGRGKGPRKTPKGGPQGKVLTWITINGNRIPLWGRDRQDALSQFEWKHWANNLTPDQREAVKSWTGFNKPPTQGGHDYYFQAINAEERGSTKNYRGRPMIQAMAQHLADAVSSSQTNRPKKTYRGDSMTILKKSLGNQPLAPGSTFGLQGFIASSHDGKLAEVYAKGQHNSVVYEINHPKGSKLAYLDSVSGEQNEYLQHNPQFRITAVEKRKTHTRVIVEVV